MSSEDERTCLVCGKGGGSFTRAVPYMCRDCHARLSPAQRVELQAIRKKALPGMAGAIVCTFAALLFFILNVSIRTYPLHFEYTFIGLGLMIAGNCINLGVVNSLKPNYRAFALKIAMLKKDAEPEMVEASKNVAHLIGPSPALVCSQWHDLAVKYEGEAKLEEALYCWDQAAVLGDSSGKLRGIQLRAKHVKANRPTDLPPGNPHN